MPFFSLFFGGLVVSFSLLILRVKIFSYYEIWIGNKRNKITLIRIMSRYFTNITIFLNLIRFYLYIILNTAK